MLSGIRKSRNRMNEITALYDSYIRTVEELERTKKPTAGLLGITKGPKDDPFHDRFADDLAEKLKMFSAKDPSSGEVRSLLEYMYEIPFQYRENHMIYWMFTAVHSLVLDNDLISRLNRADAQKIYEQYSKDYPRWERLPAQKRTLKALKAMM